MDVVFSIDKYDYAATSLYGLKDTSKKKQSVKQVYLQSTAETRLCREDNIYKSDSESLLLAFKMDWDEAVNYHTILWSDKWKFEIPFGNHGHHFLQSKEENDNAACYRNSFKVTICGGMGVH